MESLYDRMSRAAATRKVEDEANKKKYKENSSKQLLKILEKKLQTSFIGALSQFEEAFGYLWGIKKDEIDLTPQERKMRDLWNQVRTNILNNGNNQIRAISTELQQYSITFNGYQYRYSGTGLTSRPQEDKNVR